MKPTASTFAFGAALAAAALLAPGCRTIHGSGTEAEPTPATVSEDGVAPQSVVLDANQVGTPGTYKEFVLADENADRSYAIEADGLTGQTGRHVSAPPPSPDPASAVAPAAPAAPGSASVYVVQDGDIFGRIAQKNGVSQKALLDANPGLKDPNRIRIGQKLNVPPRGTGLGASAPKKSGGKKAAQKKAAATLPPKAGYTVYVVKDGDILGRIANRHKTTVKAIQEANGIADPAKLRAGTAIYVPSAAPAPAPEAEKAPAGEALPPPPAPDPEPAADTGFLGTFAN
jgi:LysM repeat protein